MFRTYWNNEATYRSKFVGGWYISGDRASRDEDGYFWFVGRDDDVINTGGHLVGPFEIESRCSSTRRWPSGGGGQARSGEHGGGQGLRRAQAGLRGKENLDLEIMNFIRKKLSRWRCPGDRVRQVIAQDRSGKIMRRMLRPRSGPADRERRPSR